MFIEKTDQSILDFAWIYKRALAVFTEGTTKEITDDFVGGWTEDKDYLGPVSRLVASGILPDGVDENDPRVQAIIERCQQAKTEI